jgi:hypothetical protein
MEKVTGALVEWMLWYYEPKHTVSSPMKLQKMVHALTDAETIEYNFRQAQIKSTVGR